MSQDNNVITMLHLKKHKLSDHDKVVYAHHAFQSGNGDQAKELLNSVNPIYYQIQLHKDLARALLCQAAYQHAPDPSVGKESEFYLIVYYLTRHITENKLHFTGSGYFYQMRDEIFKGFTQEWR